MKSIDLKAFRKANNLTQAQVGEYLGVQKSFISTIESGKDPMPKNKLTKLLENPFNWDTTMLLRDTTIHQEGSTNVVGNGNSIASQEILIAELRSQIERLQEEKNRLWQLIERLTGK